MVLVNDLSEVPRLAARVDEFCRGWNIPGRIAGRVNVALEEVVTNAISYAFPDGGRHEIAVQIEYRDGQLRASVSDDGRPFDPLSQPAPDTRAGIADRKVGGLGIHILRSLMESVEYRRIDGRNVLTFRTPAVP
jgi:anti-sigma regulatory factor (Ser/Thr protein kinase)